MKKQILLLAILSIVLFSCKNNDDKKHEARKNLKEMKNNKEAVQEENTYRLPPLPKHIYDQIFKYSDYLDVIFEDLEFSMSQDNNTSIRAFLQNINIKRTPLVKSSCKPMGHAVFLKKGNPIIEADFYHSPGCYYFVFFDEMNKPIFANSMSESGIRFFKNLKTGRYKQAN